MTAPRFVRYTLGVVLCAAAALSVAWLGASLLGGRPAVGQETPHGVVYRVPVTGVIELGLAPFVARSIREAEAQGARFVVLEIETPGGRVDAAERIVDAIKDAGLPVYAFINRRAFSAGALIALATTEIYMRPGSVIGAATPVGGDGQVAPEKIVSAMRSEMRTLAEAHGRDPLIAEAMVDPDIEVPGVVEAGKLLTLTTEEAAALGYARVVEDWDALLAELGATEAMVQQTEVNWAERIVRFLTHPMVAPMLLSLGFLGLLIEIKTPSFGIAGGAGITSLALFFGGHYILGLAGLEEFLLLVAGVVLLGAEIFVIPGFGIVGALGILAILASIYLTLLTPIATSADYIQAAGVLALSLIVVVVVAWAMLRHLPASRRFATSGLMLGESMTRATGYLSQAPRPELVGATGITVTDLRPAGTMRIGDERIDVVSDASWISAGTAVKVVRSDGYRLVVRPLE
jgi:membrane-bound serine protease (ClpP class)